MSQIEFTSACGGDIGVTLEDAVVAIAFIKKNSKDMVSRVDVYDIQKGGEPLRYANLADALDYMLQLADLYRTMDMELQIQKQASYKSFYKELFAKRASRLNPGIEFDRQEWDEWADDYLASNKEH